VRALATALIAKPGRHARSGRPTAAVLGLGALSLLMLVVGLLMAVGASTAAPSHKGHAVQAAHKNAHDSVSHPVMLGNRSEGQAATTVDLPAATAAPPAAPAALISAPALTPREDFAFAPYWTLAQSGSFTLSGLSTLAYFSIGVNPDGSLAESGPGWNGYQSQALVNLITRAHILGERVVLTVNDFGQGSLDALTSSPSAPARLAAALIPLLQAKSLDGVNFDFEGEGSADQAGLTHLIAAVSGALRAADSHWQVTMDTYASSASDPSGFYNIPALAPYVDAFFVMAYELNLQGSATAAAPLTSGMFSDLTTLEQYTAVVPASKVILGTPFFGIDWPTDNGTLHAKATGPATDIAESQSQVAGRPQYWDPVTETGWTSYRVGSQWHESYFENPLGLYGVARLAARYGVRGVGIWALGMEDDGAGMIAALDGFATDNAGSTGPQATSPSPPKGTAPAHPSPGTSTTTTTPPSSPGHPSPGASTTTTTTAPYITGTFLGATRNLFAVSPIAGAGGLSLGTLSNFATNEPAYACLAHSPPLAVYLDPNLSGYYVAVATAPTDCMTQDFIFPN
jgi:spore germination protein YaaH